MKVIVRVNAYDMYLIQSFTLICLLLFIIELNEILIIYSSYLMGNITEKKSPPLLLLCPCCLSSIPLITINKALKIDIKCECNRRQVIQQITNYIAKISQCSRDYKMIIEKIKKNKQCKLHKAKTAVYYCEICEEEICSLCKNNDHFNHKVSFISDYCKELSTQLMSQYEKNKKSINKNGDIPCLIEIVINDITFYHIENNINLLKTGINIIEIASSIQEKSNEIKKDNKSMINNIKNNNQLIKKEKLIKPNIKLYSIKYKYKRQKEKNDCFFLDKDYSINNICIINRDTFVMNIIKYPSYPLKRQSSLSIFSLFPYTIHHQIECINYVFTHLSVYIDITLSTYLICLTSKYKIVLYEYNNSTSSISSQKAIYNTSMNSFKAIININKQNAFLLFDDNHIHIYDIYNLNHNKTSQIQFSDIQNAIMIQTYIFIYFVKEKDIKIVTIQNRLFQSDFVTLMTVYTNSIVSSLSITETDKNTLKGIIAMYSLEINIIDIDINNSNYKLLCRLHSTFFISEIHCDKYYNNLFYIHSENFTEIKRIDTDNTHYNYDGVNPEPISILTSIHFNHSISFKSSKLYDNTMIVYGDNALVIYKYIH